MTRQPDRIEDAYRAALGVMVEDTPPPPEWADLSADDPIHWRPTSTPRRGWTAAVVAAGVILVLVGGIAVSLLVLDSGEDVIEQTPTPTISAPSSGAWRAVPGSGRHRDIWIHKHTGAAYDAGSDLVVTSGGGLEAGRLWFDANTDQWTSSDTEFDVGPYGDPRAEVYVYGDPRAEVYDPVSGCVIVVTNEGFTFAFDVDTGTWTDLAPGQGPSPGRRTGQAMVYDTESEKVVMFGGGELTVVFETGGVAQALGDTWTYDPAQNLWTEQESASLPPPRVWPTMVYDSESDRVVLFGGAELGTGATLSSGNFIPETWLGVYGDTWIYDTNTGTWTEMHPPVSPPARAQAVMWYDPDADLVFLYGGTSRVANRPLSAEMFGGEELWAYDLDTDAWTLYQVDSPNPGLLVSAEAAFDIESGVAVVFDGFHETEAGNLVYNTKTWIYEHSESQAPD